MKKAFTMIELIITIVILSIVTYIAVGLIANTFTSSQYTTSLNRINLKVELALNEIENRLNYAIVNTVVKRKGNNIEPIDLAENNYTVLEWIGYDVDSFEADKNDTNKTHIPGWSGFCDLNNSTSSQIVTPGSNLDFTDNIINNLSSNSKGLSGSAIFFPGNYDYDNVGYINQNNNDKSGISIVKTYNYNQNSSTGYFNLENNATRITEKYKLAWSAYAVVPTNCGNDGCDLELRYNFRPWKGVDYNSNGVSKSLLINGVTVFKTYATQNRIHIKLCVKDHYSPTKTTSICKEKVIYR